MCSSDLSDREAGSGLESIRDSLATASGGRPTTFGWGPRFLHSTGQYHKGGTNDGRFVLMTAPDATATEVPGAGYTFSALKHAQALGDIAALDAAGRDVMHVHVTAPPAGMSAAIARALA